MSWSPFDWQVGHLAHRTPHHKFTGYKSLNWREWLSIHTNRSCSSGLAVLNRCGLLLGAACILSVCSSQTLQFLWQQGPALVSLSTFCNWSPIRGQQPLRRKRSLQLHYQCHWYVNIMYILSYFVFGISHMSQILPSSSFCHSFRVHAEYTVPTAPAEQFVHSRTY